MLSLASVSSLASDSILSSSIPTIEPPSKRANCTPTLFDNSSAAAAASTPRVNYFVAAAAAEAAASSSNIPSAGTLGAYVDEEMISKLFNNARDDSPLSARYNPANFQKYDFLLGPSFHDPRFLSLFQPTAQTVYEAVPSLEDMLNGPKAKQKGYEWTPISGAVYQHDMNEKSKLYSTIERNSVIYTAVEAAKECGLKHLVKTHDIPSVKVLASAEDHGEQPPHFDRSVAHTSKGWYTYALYCRTGIHCTALPRYPKTLRPADMNPENMKPYAKHLFDKRNYHFIQVQQGNWSFFDEAVIHYGMKNHLSGMRVVAFVMFMPREVSQAERKLADKYQYYEWQFFMHCYGEHSFEAALCVHRNKDELKFKLGAGFVHRYTKKWEKQLAEYDRKSK